MEGLMPDAWGSFGVMAIVGIIIALGAVLIVALIVHHSRKKSSDSEAEKECKSSFDRLLEREVTICEEIGGDGCICKQNRPRGEKLSELRFELMEIRDRINREYDQ